jgi:hypothetical protein
MLPAITVHRSAFERTPARHERRQRQHAFARQQGRSLCETRAGPFGGQDEGPIRPIVTAPNPSTNPARPNIRSGASKPIDESNPMIASNMYPAPEALVNRMTENAGCMAPDFRMRSSPSTRSATQQRLTTLAGLRAAAVGFGASARACPRRQVLLVGDSPVRHGS